MGLRIGADVGGTFTDIVIELADGTASSSHYASTKVLTTHGAPEVGILDGIARIADQEGVSLADVEQIIHGTTLATNALIERRGAKTALVTTDGFRDVIETRTESRFEQYDLNIVLPSPLIQRSDRHVVSRESGPGLLALFPAGQHPRAAHRGRSLPGHDDPGRVGRNSQRQRQ